MPQLAVPFASTYAPGSYRYRNDCGPSCVKMVVEYITGTHISVDALAKRTRLVQSDSGIKVSDVARLLTEELCVVSGLGYFDTAADLRATIDRGCPAILLIDAPFAPHPPSTLAHFVVLTGYTPDGFTVHDPYFSGWQGSKGTHYKVSTGELLTRAAQMNGGAALLRTNEIVHGATIQRQPTSVANVRAAAGIRSKVIGHAYRWQTLTLEYVGRSDFDVYRWYRILNAPDKRIVGGVVAGDVLGG